MNTRVLELIKNPKTMTESDLKILESESEKMPYAQSIRALYLFGINLYKTENYKENLSKTAAYTTDKKILYQFINFQKNTQKDEPQVQEMGREIAVSPPGNDLTTAEDIIEKTEEHSPEIKDASVVLNKFDVDQIIQSENQGNPEFILVEGEKNRLLYEGEENFLEEKAQEIDFEATKESGVITVKDDLEIKENLIINDENRSEETISEKTEVAEVLEIPKEKEVETQSRTQILDEDSSGNISFNGIEEFLPQVKFSVPKNHLDYLNPPKKELKKEEIPQEEKPISKPNYQEPVFVEISEDKIDKSQISFGDTQSFDVVESAQTVETENQSIHEIADDRTKEQIGFENKPHGEASKPEEAVIETTSSEPESVKIEAVTEVPVAAWKPMSFSANTPDALIGKTAEKEQPKSEIIPEEETPKPEEKKEIVLVELAITEEKPQASEAERPVLNVSFFGNQVSKITDQKEIPPILEKPKDEELMDSNVGIFINTWQSWLKIDRPKTAESAEKTTVVKEKIIDQFIEKNPKISQLKDEVNFVVKEKKDDISHLMTETLAKLYVEQKLYSKAIKAYEILIEKHPQKKDYFKDKIEEVKEIRKS